eukprot:10976032-Heterocapsa_arctica.AAC.1
MANRQAFQHTSDHAVNSVAKAVHAINKRTKQTYQPMNVLRSDASKTKEEIQQEAYSLGWKEAIGKPVDSRGNLVPLVKWSKQHWLEELA